LSDRDLSVRGRGKRGVTEGGNEGVVRKGKLKKAEEELT
jgi:hypothetical protein